MYKNKLRETNRYGRQADWKKLITAAMMGAIHTPTMSPYLSITQKQIEVRF